VVDTSADFMDALGQGGRELFYIYAHGHAAAPGTPDVLAFRNKLQLKVIDNLKHTTAGLSPQEWAALVKELTDAANNSASALFLSKAVISLMKTTATLAQKRTWLFDAPIVFLNTCESAQMWNGVQGSFVRLFLDRGARAVLGTESTIPVVFADEFGRAVLAALLAGDTVGEAVRKARIAQLTTNRNPLGLCYSIYGNASARIAGADEITGRDGDGQQH
jgi:hypothetical protein